MKRLEYTDEGIYEKQPFPDEFKWIAWSGLVSRLENIDISLRKIADSIEVISTNLKEASNTELETKE